MKSFFLAGRSADRSTDNIQKGLLLDAKAAVYESLFRFDDAIENTSIGVKNRICFIVNNAIN